MAFLWNFQSKIFYELWYSPVPIARWMFFHILIVGCVCRCSLFPCAWKNTLFMEFNLCSCPERNKRKTEILNYCRCQSSRWTLIQLISTLNWIHLFMGHKMLLLFFRCRSDHWEKIFKMRNGWAYRFEYTIHKSGIHKCGTPQTESLTFHVVIYQETKWENPQFICFPISNAIVIEISIVMQSNWIFYFLFRFCFWSMWCRLQGWLCSQFHWNDESFFINKKYRRFKLILHLYWLLFIQSISDIGIKRISSHVSTWQIEHFRTDTDTKTKGKQSERERKKQGNGTEKLTREFCWI